MSEPIHIISLGAGVQSSTMALMAAAGEITPMPKCAIFADTQAEPKSVYAWLDWIEKHLPFPIHRVTAGNLSAISITPKLSGKSGETYLSHSVPAYTINADLSKGNMFRQCTDKTKLTPLKREIDRVRASDSAIVWIGISRDEIRRMKESRHKGIVHAWPLVEKNITRQGCLDWMQKNGFPVPPRSACVFCPYHSDAEWLRLKTQEPEAFKAAVDYELRLQKAFRATPRLTSIPFLHPYRIPLSEVVFERANINETDLFTNECEGLCGV